MDIRRVVMLAMIATLATVAVMTYASADPEPVHWHDDVDGYLAACDDLMAQEMYSAAMYCLSRYKAAASGLWVNSASPEFAQALPVLGLIGVFSVGLSLGSAVYRR